MRTWSSGAPHFDFVWLRGWRFVTRDGPIPSLQPPPTTCVCVSVVSAWGQGPWGALAPWGWPRCASVCVCVCVCVSPSPARACACVVLFVFSCRPSLSLLFSVAPISPLCDNNLLLRWQAFILPLFLFPAPHPHRKQLSQYGFQSLYLFLMSYEYDACMML